MTIVEILEIEPRLRQILTVAASMPKSLQALTITSATAGASRFVGPDAARPELRTDEAWQVFNRHLYAIIEGKAQPP